MFSGIVETVGRVCEHKITEDANVVGIVSSIFADGKVGIGDSISVSGVCLTVVRIEGDVSYFDIATETLRCTTLSELQKGNVVNLEAALRLGDTIDGHFVSGHVDAVSRVLSISAESNTVKYEISLPEQLRAAVVSKGSVTLDGVSLTVGEVTESDATGCSFTVYIIPHTLDCTSIGRLEVGSLVNLETDILGKYVESSVKHYMRLR